MTDGGTDGGNDDYDILIFEKVSLLRDCRHWENVDNFMNREYKKRWLDFKEAKIHGGAI